MYPPIQTQFQVVIGGAGIKQALFGADRFLWRSKTKWNHLHEASAGGTGTEIRKSNLLRRRGLLWWIHRGSPEMCKLWEGFCANMDQRRGTQEVYRVTVPPLFRIGWHLGILITLMQCLWRLGHLCVKYFEPLKRRSPSTINQANERLQKSCRDDITGKKAL